MTAVLLDNAWIAALAPVAGALLIAVSSRRPWWVAPVLAAAGTSLTTLVAAAALVSPAAGAVHGGGTGRFAAGSTVWFATEVGAPQLAWAVDGLGAWMLLVVGIVATCVVVFSTGYMAGDAGWARYFALISLFTGSMNLLVLADSLTALFIGWELVGACSFLLIGFWFERPSAAAAARKAFLTTRVGDVGLLVGVAVLWAGTGSDRFADVFSAVPGLPASVIGVAAVGLAVGAIGKSAQFPLHAWLPDAMEGPTPVSALIHAATMVAAGVYLGVRAWPVFEASPAALTVLLVAGCISALGAAAAATAQCDIKKVLAYSTISQLGFMFAALGAGAPVAAFFHLVTHAAFKGLLFLTSGSVIHGSGTQDLYGMGGLRRSMPFTFAAWVAGTFALAGVAPASGFFSKDAVLEAVWQRAPGAGIALFCASALTALYMARATRLAFFGPQRGPQHPHESPASMAVPLGVLAIAAAIGGVLAGPVARSLGHEQEPLALAVSAAALALAALGFAAGWRWSPDPDADRSARRRLGGAGRVLEAAYGWDGFVDRFLVTPVVGMSRMLWAWGDRLVADGVVVALARWSVRAGEAVRQVHRGDAQAYATTIATAVALALAATVWLGR